MVTRRQFSRSATLGAIGALIPALAFANHRRAVDLVVTNLQWSIDNGVNWGVAPVPEGSAVLFRSVVKNQGKANAPSGRLIEVDFNANSERVTWGSRSNGLKAGASATIVASSSAMGDPYWHDGLPGTYSILARVDPRNLHPSEHSGTVDGELNNTRSASLTVEGVVEESEHMLFTTQVPTIAQDTDLAAVTLGVRWLCDQPGEVVAIRFYKGGTAGGSSHTVALYSATGALLASVQSAGETAGGWQRVNLAAPVPIQADTEYRAAVFWPNGRYPATPNFFSAQLDNPPLHAPGTQNGVYAYGSAIAFPTSVYQATNYFVDPIVSTEGEPPPPSGVELGINASLGGARVLSAGSAWNQPIDTLPVHSQSAAILASMGDPTTYGIKCDFGSGTYAGAKIGIPYVVVPEGQALVAVAPEVYAAQSDPGPYPIPPNAPIEGYGGTGDYYDRHVLVVQRDLSRPEQLGGLFELFAAYPQPPSAYPGGSITEWACNQSSRFDLANGDLQRPEGWTSADAAGLPIFPGLVRYDEMAAAIARDGRNGVIPHALRFQVAAGYSAYKYVHPAQHVAGWGSGLCPFGSRWRLKASFVAQDNLPTECVVICNTLQRYGMLMSDNGGHFFISGAPDERWNNDLLAYMGYIHAANFEMVDTGPILTGTP